LEGAFDPVAYAKWVRKNFDENGQPRVPPISRPTDQHAYINTSVAPEEQTEVSCAKCSILFSLPTQIFKGKQFRFGEKFAKFYCPECRRKYRNGTPQKQDE